MTATTLPFGSEHPAVAATALHWTDGDLPCSALWRSERGAPPPKKVMLSDDTMTADTAYRLACEGTALLWQGDFHNARQLLQAMARRVDQPAKRTQRRQSAKRSIATDGATEASATSPKTPANAFNLHRQAQAQRARVLGMVLIPFDAAYGIALRRAPDAHLACTEAWGAADAAAGVSVASLRELLSLISAHEWRKKGVEVPALGASPNNRIHPHYGVFSPVRGEYISLVSQALHDADHAATKHGTASFDTAFDIGTGTGVLAAVLARGGVAKVVATDMDPRAMACALDNLTRLQVHDAVQLLQTDLFPPGLAALIVCNPPWLPARPSSPIEHAVYDEGSRMLLGFLQGLAAHLAPDGEGWLVLSDLAEHLGLRTRAQLLHAIDGAGLCVIARLDTKPQHAKAYDASDTLHAARAAEVTSLWRLSAKPSNATH